MSNLKVDGIVTKSDNTDLSITAHGSGKVDIETGFKVGGTAGVPVNNLRTGTDGELITWDASGDPATVAVGTDGQVLTSTGAGSPPAFEDAGGGGQWSLKTSGTVSNAANLTISSITKRILIFCQDVTMASTAELQFMTQPVTSSSFPTLNWVQHSAHTGSTTLTTTRGSPAHIPLTAGQSVSADSGRSLNCWIELPDPSEDVRQKLVCRWYSVFKIGDSYHSWGMAVQAELASHADAGAIDVCKVEASTGNLSMGNYYVWEQG